MGFWSISKKEDIYEALEKGNNPKLSFNSSIGKKNIEIVIENQSFKSLTMPSYKDFEYNITFKNCEFSYLNIEGIKKETNNKINIINSKVSCIRVGGCDLNIENSKIDGSYTIIKCFPSVRIKNSKISNTEKDDDSLSIRKCKDVILEKNLFYCKNNYCISLTNMEGIINYNIIRGDKGIELESTQIKINSSNFDVNND